MRDSTAFVSWERVSWIFFRSKVLEGGSCGGGGVLSCSQDVFDEGVVEESFKVVLHDGFPFARGDLFYASENVVKGMSGCGCEFHRPVVRGKIRHGGGRGLRCVPCSSLAPGCSDVDLPLRQWRHKSYCILNHWILTDNL